MRMTISLTLAAAALVAATPALGQTAAAPVNTTDMNTVTTTDTANTAAPVDTTATPPAAVTTDTSNMTTVDTTVPAPEPAKKGFPWGVLGLLGLLGLIPRTRRNR